MARLVGGQKVGEGVLQVFQRGSWGYISPNAWSTGGWDWRDARVLCRSLGWVTGSPVDARRFNRSTLPSGPLWLPSYACQWWEAGLADCVREVDYSNQLTNWLLQDPNSFPASAVECRNGGCMSEGFSM